MRIDSAILVATFGLIGVVIGGLITAGSSFLIEKRRDRTHLQRAKGNELRELKQAARLIDAELAQAEISGKVSVSRKQWWPAEVGPLEKNSWAQYRAVLALHLSHDDWRCIATAFEFIHGINSARAIAIREAKTNREWPIMSEEDCGKIPFGISHISAARTRLASFTCREEVQNGTIEMM